MRRTAPGYGSLGVSWCRSPFGFTVVVGLVKWEAHWHRRNREMLDRIRFTNREPPARVAPDATTARDRRGRV